jgi:hypothetical protein
MNLYELVLFWVLSLPQAYKEEVPIVERERQAEVFALAVARHADSKAHAAEAVAVAWWETKILARIQAGECRRPTRSKRGECDWHYGKKLFQARSYFQIHEDASLKARTRWNELVGLEPENVDASVDVAMQLLRRGKQVCKTSEGAISYFAVGHCRWPGAAKRAATVRQLLSSEHGSERAQASLRQ